MTYKSQVSIACSKVFLPLFRFFFYVWSSNCVGSFEINADIVSLAFRVDVQMHKGWTLSQVEAILYEYYIQY